MQENMWSNLQHYACKLSGKLWELQIVVHGKCLQFRRNQQTVIDSVVFEDEIPTYPKSNHPFWYQHTITDQAGPCLRVPTPKVKLLKTASHKKDTRIPMDEDCNRANSHCEPRSRLCEPNWIRTIEHPSKQPGKIRKDHKDYEWKDVVQESQVWKNWEK